jgi:hypothetical protein
MWDDFPPLEAGTEHESRAGANELDDADYDDI